MTRLPKLPDLGGVTKAALALALVSVLLGPPSLAQAKKSPAKGGKAHVQSVIERENGEEEAILKREEWFYSSRQQGALGRMAEMRAKAARFTWERIRLQGESGKSLPAGAPGYWVSRGPASSRFGNWTFGKVSGRIPALAKDWASGTLYVGSASGGVWKSTDDGSSWTPIFESAGTQTIGAIVVDPNHPGTLWVGTGENTQYWCEEYFGIGLLRSTDGGSSWELRNGSGSGTLQNLSYFCGITIDPRDSNKLVVGGMTKNCASGQYTPGGIYATTDAGATWRLALQGYVTSLVRDPGNPDVLWAGAYYGGVYKSTDNGVTWVQQTGSGIPTLTAFRTEVSVAPGNGSYVYALFSKNSASGHGTPEFWRTTDGGTTWAQMSSGDNACDGQCSYNMTVRVDRLNPAVVYRGTIHLFRSTDGGATWTNLTGPWGPNQKVHQDTHFLLMNPADSSEFYVGCDGGIWKTSDGGSTFRNLNANLCLTQFYAVANHPTNDDVILGGSQDNSSLARTTSDTWDMQVVDGDGFVCHINPANPSIVYAAGYPVDMGSGLVPSVYRSTGGVLGQFERITDVGSGIKGGDRINWVTPYVLDPTNPSTLFLGTNRVYRSQDGGSSWTQVGPSDMTAGGQYDSVRTLEVNAKSGSSVWAGTTDGYVWHSSDGGNAWTNISMGLPGRSVNGVASDPTSPERAFCVLGGFGGPHLYEYSGSGSWTPKGDGLPDIPTSAVILLSASSVFVGTDVGVYRSSDGGATFEPFADGMPLGAVVTDLKYNATTMTMTAGTYGRGAWQTQVSPCALSCSASGPETAVVKEPASFTATATTECTGVTAYQWDFGDGGGSSDQSPTHAYSASGTFTWRVTVSNTGATCTKSGTVHVLNSPPPAVSSMAKLGSPFRINVAGSGFQTGLQVTINGTSWPGVTVNSGTALVLGQGAALKSLVPKNTPTLFHFVNPDGGDCTFTWKWP